MDTGINSSADASWREDSPYATVNPSPMAEKLTIRQELSRLNLQVRQQEERLRNQDNQLHKLGELYERLRDEIGRTE